MAVTLCTVFSVLVACGNNTNVTKEPDKAEKVVTDGGAVDNSDNESIGTKMERVTAPEVTVTVNKNVKLDITGKLQDCIKAVCDDGGGVLDSLQGGLYKVDENGIIYKEKDPFGNSASYVTCIGLEQIPNIEMAKVGYINYSFGEEYTCDAFSLFEGWDGEFSKIGDYLNDENSISLEAENGGSGYRIAAFKNGEIVPIEEINEKYGAKAEEIAGHGSLINYFEDEDITYGNNEAVNCIPTSYVNYRNNDLQPLQFYALYSALLEWGPEYAEGKIGNLGLIMWSQDNNSLNILVACPLEEYMEIKNAEPR